MDRKEEDREGGPFVSIVTPCLNPGPRLIDCLRSVQEQTHPRIEHIVVDGGSTDGSVELLEQWKSVRWISEPDEGQSSALNKGFAMAQGEVLSWLNADDQLKRDSVRVALQILLQHQADYVYGIVEVVEGEDTRLWVPPPDPESHLIEMGKGGVIPQPGSLFKASAIKMIGGMDESLELAMDFDMWLRFIDSGLAGVFVPHVLATFYVHPDSKTGSKGLSPFFLEEARSLLKGGRTRLAGAALGRAAAQAALEDGRAEPRRLTEQIHRVLEAGRKMDEGIPQKVVQASARTEAALVELRHTWRGVRHLTSLGMWTTKETRARLLDALIRRRSRHSAPRG